MRWVLLLCLVFTSCKYESPIDHVITDDKVNYLRGISTLNLIRKKHENYFCSEIPYSIVIIDDSSSRLNKNESYQVSQPILTYYWTFTELNNYAELIEKCRFELPDCRVKDSVLVHEIGHLVVSRKAPQEPVNQLDVYASQLPDWLDELGAIAFEPEHYRRKRIRQLLSSNGSDWVSHNIISDTKIRVPEALNPNLPSEYAQLAAVFEYLEADIGGCFLDEIIYSYHKGQNFFRWFNERAGMNFDVSLVNDWLAKTKTQERYLREITE